MFRTAIARAARTSIRRTPASIVISRPVAAHFVRGNSTQVPPSGKREPTPEEAAKKAGLERQDELQRDWDAKVLTYDELLPKTQSPTPETYLIDVREPAEVIQGMIPSAVNLPLSVLSNSFHITSEAFREQHGFEKPQKHQEVIFYCRSGMRSTTASDVAKRNGYENILNYKGSWLEWTEKQNKKQ